MRIAIAVLSVLLLGLEADLPTVSADQAHADPEEESRPDSEQALLPLGAEDISAVLEELSTGVAELRGLEFKEPLQWGVKTEDELRQMLLQELAKDWPDEEISGTAKVLVKLGIWPKEKDLKEILVGLLSEQVAAFYHPTSKRFFFMGSYGGFQLRVIASHELTHVLQDQHFDLESLPLREKHNSDRALACEALVEGDATAVMLDFLTGQDTSKGEIAQQALLARVKSVAAGFRLPDVPVFLSDNLIFPYIWGLLFVQEARRRDGWQGVNRIFANPPGSTEQILHLEKYFDQRDVPVNVEIPGLESLLSDWRQIDRDVIGELNLQIILKTFVAVEEARLAAQGWGGDGLVAFESKSGDVLVAVFTTWDTEDDAQEFFLAYRQVVENKYEEEVLEDTESLVCRWSTEEHSVYVARRGKDVVVIEGVPAELLGKLQAELWQSKKSGKPPASKPEQQSRQERAPEPVKVEVGK